MAPVLHLKADSERFVSTCVHGDRVTGGSSSKVDHGVFWSRRAHRGAVRISPVLVFWVRGTHRGLTGGGCVRVAGVHLTLLRSWGADERTAHECNAKVHKKHIKYILRSERVCACVQTHIRMWTNHCNRWHHVRHLSGGALRSVSMDKHINIIAPSTAFKYDKWLVDTGHKYLCMHTDTSESHERNHSN